MKKLLILLGVVCASLPAWAQAPLKKTLPNGLTVLVQENHSAPVVAVRFYVKTGSIYEGKYLGSGISHLFEHVLGEGTKSKSKEQLNDEVQALGGQSNAYTSKEVTAYHITTASPFFERALANLSDSMRNATFPDKEVKTQIGVIHNEMNLGDDDPDRTLYELFLATAFKVHPVRLPIIGYRENFDRLTQDDIVNYYQSHYEPDNVVLSVAGDVNPERVFFAAQLQLGDWQRRNSPDFSIPDEPRQSTPRRAVQDKDVQNAYAMLGWHTVPLQNPDLYALDVLAQILGGGESSRLVRNLRERDNLVSSIGAFSSTPNYNAGFFGVRATLPAENLNRVEKAIANEAARLIRDGVTSEELARAKRGIETSFVFGNTDVENQAEQNAYDEMATGDPAYSKRYVARVQSVTAEQVQNVARKYLRADGLTTAIIRPRPTKTAATAPKTVAVSAPRLFRLPNGLRLIVRRNAASPTVAITAIGLGGTRLESADKAGVANLAAKMLTRGTSVRSGEVIAGLVDDLGGELEAVGGYNSWGLQSQWLARDFRRGLALVTESILKPSFPADELERVKAQTVAAIGEQEDDPNGAASLSLRKLFYGPHPYGRSSLGTPQSVAKISRDDVADFWTRIAQPQHTVISIYGDIDPDLARAAVENAFGAWRSGSQLPSAAPAPPALNAFTVVEGTKPGLAQTALWFGYPSIRIDNPDRYAIEVLDGALSGINLPGGRLHARLRDNQLVYVVHAYNSPGLDAGMFAIYADTARENRAQVQSIILEEVNKIRDADISDEELQRAKSMAVAAQSIDNQTNSAQAQGAASDELFGLGYEENVTYNARINAVTAADVRRVAQKYLVPDKAALAVIGPPAPEAAAPAPEAAAPAPEAAAPAPENGAKPDDIAPASPNKPTNPESTQPNTAAPTEEKPAPAPPADAKPAA